MKTYSVNSVWDTLQGEGVRAGARSVFLRFSGCNLWDGNPEHRHLGRGACSRWCDTAFANGHPMTAGAILQAMNACWPGGGNAPRWCVVTGGEPLLQLDEPLLSALVAAGWHVAVETNGSVPFKKGAEALVSHLAVSPKRGAPVVLARCDELKVVLPGDVEEPWQDSELEALAARLCPKQCFVQPQDSIDPSKVQTSVLQGNLGAPAGSVHHVRYANTVTDCIDFVKRNTSWRVGVQLHKLLALP